MTDDAQYDVKTVASLYVGVLTFVVAVIYVIKRNNKAKNDSPDIEMEEVQETIVKQPVKLKKPKKNEPFKRKVVDIQHPWYVGTLKGHTTDVCGIDFASDGKKFVSISEDRSVILWDVRDFELKQHKSMKQVVEFDTPTHASFSPDCRGVALGMKRETKIAVFKIQKKSEGSGYSFSHADNIDFAKLHQIDLKSVAISANGKYLMSAAKDNKIGIYDIRGSLLKSIDYVNSLYDCRISPDGRFIIGSGFTTDVFIYEPIFNKDGEFKDCKKVFSLNGHNSSVYATAFNSQSTLAVSVSKDGFWRIFDIDIRYNAGQDAKLIKEGKWDLLYGANNEHVKLEMSPTGYSFTICVGKTMKIFSTFDTENDFEQFSDIHESNISSLKYSSDGKFIATSGDRYIRIFRNVPEYRSTIVKLNEELRTNSNESARKRIKDQIEQAEQMLLKYK